MKAEPSSIKSGGSFVARRPPCRHRYGVVFYEAPGKVDWVHWGLDDAATLSDGFSPPYVSNIWSGNSGRGNWAPVPGDFAVVYAIRYRATSDAQSLKVELKLDAEGNRFQGQIRLSAATLARTAVK